MERNVSYGELAELESEFTKQCEKLGVEWIDEEVKQEALLQFEIDYQNGDDDPVVTLNGYGYIIKKKEL